MYTGHNVSVLGHFCLSQGAIVVIFKNAVHFLIQKNGFDTEFPIWTYWPKCRPIYSKPFRQCVLWLTGLLNFQIPAMSNITLRCEDICAPGRCTYPIPPEAHPGPQYEDCEALLCTQVRLPYIWSAIPAFPCLYPIGYSKWAMQVHYYYYDLLLLFIVLFFFTFSFKPLLH